jgi:NAD(P)-dependent dehydrogenase (short-subunit alcohol dehydrogenase family)
MTASSSATALVIGASGGLGQALWQQLKADKTYTDVLAISRRALVQPDPRWFQADATCPEQLAEVARQVGERFGKLDLLINCTGMLHETGLRPEKSLGQLHRQDFLKVMSVNAFAPLVALQTFTPLLRKAAGSSGHGIAVTLSAMVGSISDNRLGGWYSYRMSKAALNMGLRNAAIELDRYVDGPVVVAIHPGTTLTGLSEPFVGKRQNNQKVRSAACSAVHILHVVAGLSREDTGKFLNWDGRELEW